jgi:phenylalanyl-tRNA synthetase beta chain
VPTVAEPGGLTLPDPVGDQATLRTTLLHGLVEAARRNAAVGNDELAFFEIARVYLPRQDNLPDEQVRVAALVEGGCARAKGVVEALYGALKVELAVEPTERPFLYPGRAAALVAGWLGELHPELLEGRWGAFELDLESLCAASRDPVQYEDVLTFPPVKHDFAFVVDASLPAEALFAAAREAAGPELREVRFLSDFREPPIPAGKKSLAFRAEFRSPERTLTDNEVAPLRERIVTSLAQRFGAELRA